MPDQGKWYRSHYKAGSGLWLFDPVEREWSVSEKDGLAAHYAMAECTPKQPDWIFVFGKGANHAVNWKTGQVRKLKAPSGRGGFVGMTYYPVDESFLCFPCSGKQPANTKILKYDIARDQWKEIPARGDVPFTFDINVVYDERQKVFACFSRGYFYYWSPAQEKWYKLQEQIDPRLDNRPVRHHHIYDPVNNLHIVLANVPNPRWLTIAFKFSDTPGKHPGTAKN